MHNQVLSAICLWQLTVKIYRKAELEELDQAAVHSMCTFMQMAVQVAHLARGYGQVGLHFMFDAVFVPNPQIDNSQAVHLIMVLDETMILAIVVQFQARGLYVSSAR